MHKKSILKTSIKPLERELELEEVGAWLNNSNMNNIKTVALKLESCYICEIMPSYIKLMKLLLESERVKIIKRWTHDRQISPI